MLIFIVNLYLQGREFCNQVMDRLEVHTGFRHRVTSAYHPQSNGLDERFNQTLKTSLQRLVNEHQTNWDELIDDVLFAYRTSRQDSTKYTPFFLMHGREARLPIDVQLSVKDQSDTSDIDHKVTQLIEIRSKAHLSALNNISKAQENQKRQYDAKHNGRTSIKVNRYFSLNIQCIIY